DAAAEARRAGADFVQPAGAVERADEHAAGITRADRQDAGARERDGPAAGERAEGERGIDERGAAARLDVERVRGEGDVVADGRAVHLKRLAGGHDGGVGLKRRGTGAAEVAV